MTRVTAGGVHSRIGLLPSRGRMMELAIFIPLTVMQDSAKAGITGGGFMVWARLRPIWEAVNSCRADGAGATIYESRSNE